MQVLGEMTAEVSLAHRPQKCLRALEVSYARAPYHRDVMDWLDPFLAPSPGEGLMELNIRCIEATGR